MPVQEFALDARGNSVQVFFSDESENVTILLNGSIIGVIPSREELRTTRAFAHPDGSTLSVQLVGTQFQVFRDGQRLWQNPHGVPPQQLLQAAPLPLGEAIRQLPEQYIKVLGLVLPGKRSAITFAEQQSKASWGMVWIQLICFGLLVAVPAYLANTSKTGFSGLGLIVTSFFAMVVISLATFIVVGNYYLIARAFGGQGTFLAHIYTTLLYTVPLGFLTSLIALIPWLVRLVPLGTGVWEVVLSVQMIKEVHRLSGGKATAVVLIPVAAIVVLLVTLTFAVRALANFLNL